MILPACSHSGAASLFAWSGELRCARRRAALTASEIFAHCFYADNGIARTNAAALSCPTQRFAIDGLFC